MMNATNGGRYIDGEAKAAEILTALSLEDRERILRYICTKNPPMGRGLSQKCHSFDTLVSLGAREFRQLSSRIHPKVLGIALKQISEDYQREILGRLDRDYAEQCYEALVCSFKDESSMVSRAQARVMEVVGEFF